MVFSSEASEGVFKSLAEADFSTPRRRSSLASRSSSRPRWERKGTCFQPHASTSKVRPQCGQKRSVGFTGRRNPGRPARWLGSRTRLTPAAPTWPCFQRLSDLRDGFGVNTSVVSRTSPEVVMTVSTPPESLMEVMLTSDSSCDLLRRSGATGRWAVTGATVAACRNGLAVVLLAPPCCRCQTNQRQRQKPVHRATLPVGAHRSGHGFIVEWPPLTRARWL
ncbi:MAG: hypothetical protein CM15mP78_15890 [Candidatus Poseidoniales archaeon]|nr:MAG: hypothetical protein CM15mP78_15890 [Candidatus Poseidoniales archaeon]